MLLNEDALRKAFEQWFGAPVPLQRDNDGNYVYMAAHSAWQTFKAAYSPEVLQSLGVVIQDRPLIARSLAEWHEDDGPVMWWAWCGNDWAGEPAWNGSPTDSDWPGYHTHWTPHPIQPQAIKEQS